MVSSPHLRTVTEAPLARMAPSGLDDEEAITHHHKRDHGEEAPENSAASLDVFATPLQRPVLGLPM